MMSTGSFTRSGTGSPGPAAIPDDSSELVGKRGTPFRMLVEEGKIAEFAAATRTPVARGDRELVAPVTFLASCLLWMAPENDAWFGVERDFRRILHGEQAYTFRRGPIRAGTELTGQQRIESVYRKTGTAGGMTFTELVTDFWTDDPADPVASARTVSITMDAMPERAASGDAAAVPLPPVPDGFDEVESITDSPYSITDFVRYQGASGDFNPIHHDTEFALAAGYPSPFAIGMLTAGIAAGLVTRHVDISAVQRFRVRWSAQAWPHDTISYRVSRSPEQFQVLASRPDGRSHMTAWANVAEPS